MRGYKQRSRKLPQFAPTFALGAALALQACAPQQPGAGSVAGSGNALSSSRSENATFVVDPLASSGADHQVADAAWNARRRHVVTLRACLRDIGKLQPVVAQSFVVRGGGEEHELSTDANGCLTWNESTEFNWLARESFIRTGRVIEPRGMHRGTRSIPLAIDPWRTDASSVIDLRYGKPSDPTEHDVLRTASRLSLENIAVSFGDQHVDGDASALSLQLAAQPQIIRVGLDDRPIKEFLRTAKLRVDLAIIERLPGQGNGGSDRRSPIGAISFEASLNRGNLQLQDQIRLSRLPRKDAILEVALRLTPLEAPEDLEAFEGLLLLPALSGPASSTIKAIPGSYDVYAESKPAPGLRTSTASAVSKSAGACSDGSEGFGFYFTSWSVAPNSVTRVTRNEGVPSSVSVTVSACMASPIDQKPLAGHVFSATFAGATKAESVEVTTDAKGCVSWQENVSFDYFGPERWLNRRITLRGRNAPIAGIERSVSVPIDPWREGSQFSWDCRAGKPPALTGGRQAQLELQSFGYAFRGQDFKLDRGLNLSIVRHYLVRLEPKIRRQDALDKVATYENVRDGRFKLRAIVVSPSNEYTSIGSDTRSVLNGAKLLASAEQEVQVVDGLIQQDLPLAFDFKTIPLLNSRNLLFVELAPLGSSSLRKVSAQAAFVPSSEQGQIGLTATARGVQEITDNLAVGSIDVEALARANALRRGGADKDSAAQLREMFGLRAVNEAEAYKAGLTPGEFRMLVSGTGSLIERADALAKICPLSKDPLGCKRGPKDQLQVTSLRHVISLIGNQEIRSVDSGTIMVNAALSQDVSATESDSEGSSLTTTASAGGRINLRIGSFESPVGGGIDAGINIGKTWFTTHTTSVNSGHSSSASLIFGRTLATDQIELSFDAQVLECAMIRPVGSAAPSVGGIHLCSTSPIRKRLTESWYYINQTGTPESTPLRDGRLAASQPYSKVVRGKRAFARFKNALEDSTKVLVLKRDTAYADQQARLTDAQRRFIAATPEYSDGAFPSVVVSP